MNLYDLLIIAVIDSGKSKCIPVVKHEKRLKVQKPFGADLLSWEHVNVYRGGAIMDAISLMVFGVTNYRDDGKYLFAVLRKLVSLINFELGAKNKFKTR